MNQVTNSVSDLLNTNEIINLRKYVNTFNIIDIGTITGLNDEGRVDVIGNRMIGENQPVTYTNIEVITPGFNGGGIQGDLTNATCLILTPGTCMPNTLDQKVIVGAKAFDARGLKVLPLMKPSAQSFLYFHQDGVVSLSTSNNSFRISPIEGLTFSSGGTNVTLDENGNIGIQNGDSYFVILADGTTRKGVMKDGKWIFIHETKEDGTITTYRGNKDSECYPSQIMDMVGIEKWESVITTSSDGSISISSGDDLTVSLTVSSDAVSVSIEEGCTFEMTKDEVSINGSNLVVSK